MLHKFFWAVLMYLVLDKYSEDLFCLKHLSMEEIKEILSSTEIEVLSPPSLSFGVNKEYIEVFFDDILLLSICPDKEDIICNSEFCLSVYNDFFLGKYFTLYKCFASDSPINDLLNQLAIEMLLFMITGNDQLVRDVIRVLKIFDKKEILALFSQKKLKIGSAILCYEQSSYGIWFWIDKLREETIFPLESLYSEN